MNTSSSVGLPSVIASICPGNASTSLRDPLVAVGHFQAHRAIHHAAFAAEAIANARRQPLGRRRLNGDGVAADGGSQGVGRIERHEFSLIENRDAIGFVGFFQQVRRQHDGYAVMFAQFAQVVPQIAAGRRIQAGARLVEQQQLRLV